MRFHRYTTNYGGPLRAGDSIAKGASFQFYAVVLGWKEFAPDYVPKPAFAKPKTANGQRCCGLVFDQPQSGQVKPAFSRKLGVENGVLKNRLISPNHSFCEPPSANLWLDSHDFAATPEA